MGDSYAKMAKRYDSFIEPLVRRLRSTGLTMFPPRQGLSVLDIGCGTGTHLDIYHRAGCRVFGIDLSPAMLNVAQAKLAGQAALHLGDASQMPFSDESFDLVLATLLFHEMSPPLRSPIIGEARRVMKKSGRFLVIDYHPGPARFPEGWISKTLITSLETLAGREHARNYYNFMANKGLPLLLAENGLLVDEKKVVGGGTIGLYLLRSN